jgi:predicted RNA binding protein YcfA (HicA-like mRNA interferase family)
MRRVPKLPRLTSTETLRALERAGFARVSQKGSHIKMRRGDRICIVPFHSKSLAVGTLHSILKQAGVSVDELLDLLK